MRLDDYSIRLLASINRAWHAEASGLPFSHNMLMHISPAKTVATMQEQVNTLQRCIDQTDQPSPPGGANHHFQKCFHARCAESHGNFAIVDTASPAPFPIDPLFAAPDR